MLIDHLKNKVYYAQNREDLILEAFFPDETKGFYVDVGAYDPDYDSVTKLFYKKGWRGINVEPQPGRYKKFLRLRPRDVNINAGIGAHDGVLMLRSYKNNGLSTFSPKIREEYSATTSPDTGSYEDIETKVYSLKNIFKKYKVTDINFMKIDVEGFEYEVLEGNDWSIYRPKVICLESNHIVKDWRSYITSQGYEFVFFDGLNDYYVDARNSVKISFDYVSHILMKRGGGIAYKDYIQVNQLHNALNDKIREIEVLQDQVAIKSEENNNLHTTVSTLESILNSRQSLVKILIKRTLGFK